MSIIYEDYDSEEPTISGRLSENESEPVSEGVSISSLYVAELPQDSELASTAEIVQAVYESTPLLRDLANIVGEYSPHYSWLPVDGVQVCASSSVRRLDRDEKDEFENGDDDLPATCRFAAWLPQNQAVLLYQSIPTMYGDPTGSYRPVLVHLAMGPNSNWDYKCFSIIDEGFPETRLESTPAACELPNSLILVALTRRSYLYTTAESDPFASLRFAPPINLPPAIAAQDNPWKIAYITAMGERNNPLVAVSWKERPLICLYSLPNPPFAEFDLTIECSCFILTPGGLITAPTALPQLRLACQTRGDQQTSLSVFEFQHSALPMASSTVTSVDTQSNPELCEGSVFQSGDHCLICTEKGEILDVHSGRTLARLDMNPCYFLCLIRSTPDYFIIGCGDEWGSNQEVTLFQVSTSDGSVLKLDSLVHNFHSFTHLAQIGDRLSLWTVTEAPLEWDMNVDAYGADTAVKLTLWSPALQPQPSLVDVMALFDDWET